MAHSSTQSSSGALVIVADLGGTKCSASAVDTETGCLVTDRLTRLHNGGDFLEVLLGLIDEIKQAVPPDRTVSGVGIACAGLVDSDAGVIIHSINLKVKSFPLAQLVHERCGLPCSVANDLHCATLGELTHGAGRGFQNFLVVFAGTGVGARQVTHGNIVPGENGLAGEFGQTLVPAVTASNLSCQISIEEQKYLTLENLCSHLGVARHILNRLGRSELKSLSYQEIQSLCDKPDCDYDRQVVELSVKEAAITMAVNLGNLALFTDPALIILGGGAIGLIPNYFEQICHYTLRLPLIDGRNLQIVKAELGDNAGLIGAAMLPISK